MVVLDAGHGGFDPGGGSNEQFKEKNMTLNISRYQNNRFRELGIDSALVRTGDETLTPQERINKINSFCCTNTDILISNHINNAGSGGGEVIYSIRNNPDLPNAIGEALEQVGLPIRSVYTRPGRTGNDFYFVLRQSPGFDYSMIIEYGFADVPADVDRLIYEWPTLAEAVVKAVANHLGVSYSPPSYAIHIVRPGESLFTISQKYNVPISRIIDDNKLATSEVFPGQTLVVNF